MNKGTEEILAGIRAGLKPPTQAEIDEAMARWMFGKNAERIMAHAPWSLALIKLMWKKREEPWES
ncbi:MAG: hypothetical protein GX620_00660 [Chloroflexi bacterium]|nr:hypothetical protein [Chloroflexota bacterium]